MNKIVLWREKDEPRTNVEHKKVYHSPDGFEWGYSGSGPAELALNILLYYLDEEAAMRLHQNFKAKFIASMPFEGGIINESEIRNFIEWNMVVS